MKRPAKLAVASTAALALLTSCAFNTGGDPGASEPPRPEGPVELTFQSLAWQEKTIAATEEIVEQWNADNPDITVTIRQGSWDNVHDQLVTQFEGGTAPDIIHNQAADMFGFADQGYLADLGPQLTDEVKGSVDDSLWESVTTPSGLVLGSPTLMQTYVVFANEEAFADAGVEVPSGDQLTWDELLELSEELTADGTYGIGWGLSQPTAALLTMSPAFGGTYFDVADDGSAEITVGDGELAVPRAVHQMAHEDKSIDPVTLTQSGSDALPGFFDGKYAMFVGGSYLAQQMSESSPDGFRWTVLPPLAGTESTAQAVSPQTLSVSAQSEAVPQAAEFVQYVMQPENQAKLAEGDWLIPATTEAREKLAADQGEDSGWPALLATADTLEAAKFAPAVNYPRWKDQQATPAFQKYLGNEIDEDQLKTDLTEGWAAAGG